MSMFQKATDNKAVAASNSSLDAALIWAERGIPVFPCHGNQNSEKYKRPHTPRGFKDATTDAATIKAWWAKHPDAMIGVPTGPASGFDVVDPDRKNGKDGFAFIPDWETLSPAIVRTPSGGAHLYFRSDGTIKNATDVNDMIGVDVRGDGGYVIAPGSAGYMWADGRDDLSNLPPFPEAFRPGSNRPKLNQKLEERFQPAGQPGDNPYAEPWVLGIALEAVPTPNSYTPWNNVAMAIYRATEGSEDGFEVFDRWSRKDMKNYGGTRERWEALEISPPNSIGAGTVFHMADEADRSWRERAEAVEPGWQQRAIIDSSQRTLARLARFFETDRGRGIAVRIQTYFAEVGPRRAATHLHAVSLADFDGQTVPPRQFIVEGMIPDRNVTDLSGDGGTGKSILALQASVAIVTGTEWLGFPVVPGRVLYVSCEDEMDEIRRRAEALCRQREITFKHLRDLYIIDLTTADGTELAALDKGKLSLTVVFAGLEEKIAELRPKLVILDTRADVFAGDEVNRSQVRGFVKALRRLCFQYDLAILMLSHPSLTGMSSGSGQSGSTAWGNSVRSRLYLDRPKGSDGSIVDPDLRVLSTKKANYSASDTEVSLRYVGGEFVAQREGALSELDPQVRGHKVEDRFVELLKDYDLQGRHVNDAGTYYAPKAFAETDPSIGQRHFRTAMLALLKQGRIKKVQRGPASRATSMLVMVQP
ncbi:AAA family ATPase [Mesorhizobium sp. M0317]|uniref:AAA family ATPase n=1 Tax=Mesorhizobium sp. M0317 TaxID=2956935 RepID=UPI00333C132E